MTPVTTNMLEEEKLEKKKIFIRWEESKGNLVYYSGDQGFVRSIDRFIKQPLEGMLYDLNRLPEVVMTFIDDPKWVNDYAVYLVIKKLKEHYDNVNGMTILTEVAKPENWRRMPMYTEGERRDMLVWVGDPHIILQAQEAVKEGKAAVVPEVRLSKPTIRQNRRLPDGGRFVTKRAKP